MAPGINVYDSSIYERGMPHERFAWLRDNAPIYWHAEPPGRGPGFWAITRHEDIVEISRDPETFSSYQRSALLYERNEKALQQARGVMLNQDPPEHTRRRRLVSRGFTSRQIDRLERHVRDICRDLLEQIIPRGEADFVRDIAAPLPLQVICELLGVPAHDRGKFFEWSNQVIGFEDPEFAGAQGMRSLYRYAVDLAAQRRISPRDDIVTTLVTADEEGQILTDVELGMFVVLLGVGGHETVRNAAAGGMLAFLEHPDQWQRIQEDPSLLSTAPDEIIRWVSPVIQFRRTATRDTHIHDQEITKGDKVVVFYPSANRDPAVFERPDVFDIGRTPNPHLGFGGGGPHYCLGAHLARLELRELFTAIADRLPHIALAAHPQRLRSNFINGIKTMPLRFSPSSTR